MRYGAISLAALIAFMLACADSEDNRTPVSQMSAVEQMVIAFEGNHSAERIKAGMDKTLPLYSLPTTEENYSRAGSVLVELRKKTGVNEMDILDCIFQRAKYGTSEEFPYAAAVCATSLEGV